jgi:hypothetical protein
MIMLLTRKPLIWTDREDVKVTNRITPLDITTGISILDSPDIEPAVSLPFIPTGHDLTQIRDPALTL